MCTCVWACLPWHMWDSGELQKAWFSHSTAWISGIKPRVSSLGAIVTLPSEPACHTATSLRYLLSCKLHQLIWCVPIFHFRKDSDILNNQGKYWVCDQLSTEQAHLFLFLCFSTEENKATIYKKIELGFFYIKKSTIKQCQGNWFVKFYLELPLTTKRPLETLIKILTVT